MIHIIQNHPAVPAGVFGEILQEKKITSRTVHAYAGEALPAAAETLAVIVLGGYMGVNEEKEHPFLRTLKAYIRRTVETGIPLLGVCLGGQLLAEVMGGSVASRHRGEKGLHEIRLTSAGQDDPLFAGLPPVFAAFEWHNDSFDVPPGALHLATSAACPGQAFRYHNAWGLQFHPEVDTAIVESWSAPADPQGELLAAFTAAETTHTTRARRLLQNFLGIVAGTGKNLPPSLALHSAGDENPLPPLPPT